MASRAILRRRKVVSDCFNSSPRSIYSFQSLGNAGPRFDSRSLYTSGCANRNNDDEKEPANSLVVSCVPILGYFRGYSTASCLGLGYVKSEFCTPMSAMSLLSVRYATTATAKQPEMGRDDEGNECMVGIRRKEASPEECDQAVEGLSSVKARAKARRLQESKKFAKAILLRTWDMLLEIGPALRSIASMSREDWAKKLVHLKHEFISTLQHYWLGTKLLWADMRISSRLLLKLAGGKSLSRSERQQLTRTTADIFRLFPVAVFLIHGVSASFCSEIVSQYVAFNFSR